MGQLYDQLSNDVRFVEGLKACLNCGTCTAICPAAEFYNYQPRKIADILQSKNDHDIESIAEKRYHLVLRGMYVMRHPLSAGKCARTADHCARSLSQELGYFVESEKGRQQLAIKRTVGEWILEYGYCLFPAEYIA